MNVRGVMDGTDDARNNCWVVKENLEEDEDIIICDSSKSSSIGSFSEDSINSVCSSSSSELAEDASSSSTNYLSISSSSSSTHSNGPLYELSELVNNLPLKRGLSMFYKGKAQSFTSLARVGSIEDLPKKEKPYKKKMKSCKSFGGGLDGHHRTPYSPHATISKKASRGSSFASLLSKRGSNFLGGSSRSTSIAERNNF